MTGHTIDTPWEAVRARADRAVLPERNRLLKQRRTRVVCLGGGTGQPVVLRGLARFAEPRPGDAGVEITAVVAMSDDGGSSGRLRRTRGLLPPGDIRNCLVALAGGDSMLREVFGYRFGGAKGLAGHAVGNLLIAALAELKGDFLEAVRTAQRLLDARGTVLPSTLTQVQLVAEREGEGTVIGERNLSRSRGKVRRVALRPRRPPPADGILEAIAAADLVAIGPGSLYSSVLPNLLVDGVAKALTASRALKVLVCNLMTQPTETDGMSGADHVRALLEHAGPVVDVAIYNSTLPNPQALSRYAARGAHPLEFDRRGLLAMGVLPIEADLLREGRRVRHDGRKVARWLLRLARSGV
ncbi:MAG: YvcK family protein [Myxococcales bacterium]|nr:YvcK family protein [Myxococcales bacterium]